jgi:phosphoglycerate dehydrogenase-like enzyme
MQIVVVSQPGIDYAIAPVEAALREKGHEVVRHKDVAAFLARQDALATADLLYVSGAPCTRAMMERAPKLRAVVTPWIGVDSFDIPAATELGIVIANGQVPENYLSMAEATIMLVLACLHNFPEKIEAMKNNVPPPPRQKARMLRGKTLGMIGFGNMARAIAQRLANWEVTLQTYTPRLRAPLPEGVARVDLDTLLRTSDIVCILATLNKETRGLLTLEKLKLMKPEAILVNTARGGIVEEAAIVAIAQEGRLHKIALDVFETEPLPPTSPLRGLPNMILPPHGVGLARVGAEAIATVAIENIARARAGEPPLYVLNPAVLPAWQRRWPRSSPPASG